MKKNHFILIVSILLILCNYNLIFAHCDTKDGPVVTDARKAIDQNNVNYVLKWVQPVNEIELRETFQLIMKVRVLSSEAKQLSDNYFFETVVRLHRNGEGESYTGIKPSGTPIDVRIQAADKSIAIGNLYPLNDLVPKANLPELKKRFDKVMMLKNFDVNNVQAGREYIEAYVQFFHYAEGEEEAPNHEQLENAGFISYIPWILTGIFFITSIIYGFLYYRD